MVNFDRYNLEARFYPAILSALPILLLIVPAASARIVLSVLPVAVAGGVFFFLINFTRTQGLRVERNLIAKWDGLPTTHMLRFRNAESQALLTRRRLKIEMIYGESLPDEKEELEHAADADRIYMAAVRSLIGRVNRERDRFPRVHDENIQYGYRRNLLGLKSYGLALTVMAIAVDIYTAVHQRSLLPQGIVGCLHLAILAIWVFVVTDSWVREAADRYTMRLFEALDAIEQ